MALSKRHREVLERLKHAGVPAEHYEELATLADQAAEATSGPGRDDERGHALSKQFDDLAKKFDV